MSYLFLFLELAGSLEARSGLFARASEREIN